MKKTTIIILLAGFCVSLFGQASLTNAIKSKLNTYNQILPYEKVYLQCDRPLYKPGDDIWMALWVTDGITNKASSVSEIVNVELINPKGTVENLHRILVSNGRTSCDFHLDSSAMGGIYKIKAYTNWMQNFSEESFFIKEVQVQTVSLPRLRMKLELDKKAYGAGDSVKGYFMLQSLDNSPISNFYFSYKVNLNGEEYFISSSETDNNGKAIISFALPQNLKTKDGLLLVNINYKGENESVSRSIPIIMDEIDLQFFPEGGDLVFGTTNNCAFKALNKYGKPADIEGAVFNSKHKMVGQFKSYHHGMGSFRLMIEPGEKYYALIDKPQGILQLYPLPPATENGFLMEIPEPMKFTHPEKNREGRLRIFSPENSTISLIAQVQGKIIYSSLFEVKKGENSINIPLKDFPCGLAQLTLLTKDGVEACERLIFIKKDQQLKIEISPDKKCYTPREKVNLDIKATDANGAPAKAQLAIAVVDDKLLSLANDKSDNILSYLLLSSEVRGKIEEPEFYFNPEEAKADSALDYLLLTQGWRRFTWEEIVEKSSSDLVKSISFNPEKRILCGTISGQSKSVIINTKLFIKETGQQARPNKDGYYEFKNLDLSSPVTLIAISDGDTIKTVVKDYTSVKTEYNLHYYNYDQDEVRGVVKDKNTGEPIAGANVLLKGTTIGTVTDVEGRFVLDIINNKNTLAFSFVGFKTKELEVSKRKSYTIALEEDAQILDDIVVVGYGLQRKRNITGAVVRIQRNKSIEIEAHQDNVLKKNEKKVLKPVQEQNSKIQSQTKTEEGTNFYLGSDNISEKEVVEDEMIFMNIEEPAVFQGGDLSEFLRYIGRNIQYPQVAMENGVQGKVIIQFTVNKKGEVVDPVILRSVDPSLDREALRIVATVPGWRPARQQGRPVNTQFIIPVFFKLMDGGTAYSYDEQEEKRKTEDAKYYRAREFYSPIYNHKQEVELRTDFRKTIYWNPLLTTDSTGTAHAEFYTSDELTTFRAISEGISSKGEIGRVQNTFYAQKPVPIDAKIPEFVSFEDSIFFPIVIKNNTNTLIHGKLHVEFPSFLNKDSFLLADITIPAREVFTYNLELTVPCKRDIGNIKLTFETDSFNDVISYPIASQPYGYPQRLTFNGSGLNNIFNLQIPDIMPNTLESELIIYPSIASSFISSVKSLIKEPHGCFEQISAITYPSIQALQYLKETGQYDKQLEETAINYIKEGYKKLIQYETPTKGFEWFGKSPAHEGLTAMGLMEFNDMKSVCPIVDTDMFNRNLAWLLSRKDNKGGFLFRNGMDNFNTSSYLLNNAYIIYALWEIGNINIRPEFERSYTDNINRNDAYCLALLFNTSINLKDSIKSDKLLTELKQQIKKHGINNLQSNTSVVGSGGNSLSIETVSLIALALLKYPHPDEDLLNSCINFIKNSRSFGVFGSTQANILALKALTKFRQTHKDLFTPGEVSVSINDNTISNAQYSEEQTEPITIDSLANYLTKENNTVKVNFEKTLKPTNLSLNVEYFSRTLVQKFQPPLIIETTYKNTTMQKGEILHLTTNITNTWKTSQSMSVAVISIPAGFSFQPWQLKELQEKNTYDYFEISNNQLYIYYRSMNPNETKTFSLDLIANIPGIYHGAQAKCYLYYTPELISFAKPATLKIIK